MIVSPTLSDELYMMTLPLPARLKDKIQLSYSRGIGVLGKFMEMILTLCLHFSSGTKLESPLCKDQ